MYKKIEIIKNSYKQDGSPDFCETITSENLPKIKDVVDEFDNLEKSKFDTHPNYNLVLTSCGENKEVLEYETLLKK